MAAGKKDEKPNKDEKAAGVGTDEAKQKKKKLFLFIGLAVLLVVISVGATFFIVKKMLGGAVAGSDGASAAESSESADVAAKPAIYFPLKTFTVNYDVNGRQRFLQTELTLMYRDEELLKTLELHMPTMRNSIVMLLSRQVFDELQTAEGKEKLRVEVLEELQDLISREAAASAGKSSGKNKSTPDLNIEQVLFTQFVMQ